MSKETTKQSSGPRQQMIGPSAEIIREQVRASRARYEEEHKNDLRCTLCPYSVPLTTAGKEVQKQKRDTHFQSHFEDTLKAASARAARGEKLPMIGPSRMWKEMRERAQAQRPEEVPPQPKIEPMPRRRTLKKTKKRRH